VVDDVVGQAVTLELEGLDLAREVGLVGPVAHQVVELSRRGLRVRAGVAQQDRQVARLGPSRKHGHR